MHIIFLTNSAGISNITLSGDFSFADKLGGLLEWSLKSNKLVKKVYSDSQKLFKYELKGEILQFNYSSSSREKRLGFSHNKQYSPIQELQLVFEDFIPELLSERVFGRGSEKPTVLTLPKDSRFSSVIFHTDFSAQFLGPEQDVNVLFQTENSYFDWSFFEIDLLSMDQEKLTENWCFQLHCNKKNVRPKIVYGHHKSRLLEVKQRKNNIVVFNISSVLKSRYRKMQIVDRDGSASEYERPDPYFKDGKLVGLSLDKGELIWEANFEYQVDDILLIQTNKILVTTERELVILDGATGAEINRWDSGIRDAEERVQTGSNQLLLIEDKVFHISYKDCRIQIYQEETMELLRTIDGVERGLQFGADRPKIFEKTVFLPVDLRYEPFSGGAWLVFDVDKWDAELEFEEEPNFKITCPTKEEPGIITCEVDHPDWGTMLRFAERKLTTAVVENSAEYAKKFFKPRKLKLTYSGFEAQRSCFFKPEVSKTGYG